MASVAVLGGGACQMCRSREQSCYQRACWEKLVHFLFGHEYTLVILFCPSTFYHVIIMAKAVKVQETHTKPHKNTNLKTIIYNQKTSKIFLKSKEGTMRSKNNQQKYH